MCVCVCVCVFVLLLNYLHAHKDDCEYESMCLLAKSRVSIMLFVCVSECQNEFCVRACLRSCV